MAQCVQSVTLSLTLPMSCQICLGKVRHPVICTNNHVFCSTCIEVWLKKNSQCPTCRIPITPENPCKEIIGATNESECNDSQSVRKHLRKTRFELLLKECEDEIEALQKENEDLRNKNIRFESQLKTVLDPSTLSLPHKNGDCKQKGEDKRDDPNMLKEWENKLKAAADIYEKVKSDMEKLKEANKNLRAQIIDLVRDNLHLKAEVENRSPQKFGRFTVAALEAKIDQYERDSSHLRRALERSDKYIEELEAHVSDMERKLDEKDKGGDSCEVVNVSIAHSQLEEKEVCSKQLLIWNNESQKNNSKTNRKAINDMENTPECIDLDMKSEKILGSCRCFSTTATESNMSAVLHKKRESCENGTQKKERNSLDLDLSVPYTPSSSFSFLSLNSPNDCSQKTSTKPLSYLRKLCFDDFSSNTLSDVQNETTENHVLDATIPVECKTQAVATMPVFWGTCHLGTKGSGQACPTQTGEQANNGRSKSKQIFGRPFHDITKANHIGMSSEASMDAAYLDKICELDSMISESESSRCSHFSLSKESTDLGTPLISELACVEPLNEVNTRREQKVRKNQHVASCSEEISESITSSKPLSKSNKHLQVLQMKEESCSSGDEDTWVNSLQMKQGSSQSDEMSFDLLFDLHESSQEVKPGSSSSSNSTEAHHNQTEDLFPVVSSVKSESVNRTESNDSTSQLIKRKSMKAFHIASPSKISKCEK
ncbi:ORC ubiquitin ligase 1 [Lepisosteus oculatus]|uniref:ORC ubiquitin ligase 1 n=1 Tax=Lepisosteus oculatus TaxID=7918 RepID=UPI0035F517E3